MSHVCLKQALLLLRRRPSGNCEKKIAELHLSNLVFEASLNFKCLYGTPQKLLTSDVWVTDVLSTML